MLQLYDVHHYKNTGLLGEKSTPKSDTIVKITNRSTAYATITHMGQPKPCLNIDHLEKKVRHYNLATIFPSTCIVVFPPSPHLNTPPTSLLSSHLAQLHPLLQVQVAPTEKPVANRRVGPILQEPKPLLPTLVLEQHMYLPNSPLPLWCGTWYR